MKSFQLVFTSLLFVVVPSSATTLSFSSVPSTIQKGKIFIADVHITGGVDIYAWQFDVGFDPTVLRARGIIKGTYLSADSTPTFFGYGAIDNDLGVIDFNYEWIFAPDGTSGKNGDGWLASFGFVAKSEGTSQLTLFNAILKNSRGESLAFDVEPISVTVTAAEVPEPAAALSVLGGLAALGCLRRKPRT